MAGSRPDGWNLRVCLWFDRGDLSELLPGQQEGKGKEMIMDLSTGNVDRVEQPNRHRYLIAFRVARYSLLRSLK